MCHCLWEVLHTAAPSAHDSCHNAKRYICVCVCVCWIKHRTLHTCGSADATVSFTAHGQSPLFDQRRLDGPRATVGSAKNLSAISLSSNLYPSHYNDRAIPYPRELWRCAQRSNLLISTLSVVLHVIKVLRWNCTKLRAVNFGTAVWSQLQKAYCAGLYRPQGEREVPSVLQFRTALCAACHSVESTQIPKCVFDVGLFLLHWPASGSICLVPLESFPLLYVLLITINAHECSNSNYTLIYFTKTFFAKCDAVVTVRIGTSDSGVAEHSDCQAVLRVAIGCRRCVVPSSVEDALDLLILTTLRNVGNCT